MRRDVIGGEARALREVVTELGRPAKTTPVPRHVPAQIVAFAARALAAGWNLPAVAQAVGVSIGSVRNWRREPPVTALVPVVVTPSRVGERAVLTVVAPSGYRVEGLDAATTAAQAGALGADAAGAVA
jgi:hypothetical protein